MTDIHSSMILRRSSSLLGPAVIQPPTPPSNPPPSPPPEPAPRAIDGQLRSIGKGVVQANLRLARVLEALDSGGTPRSPQAVVDTSAPLFDLVDALDAALGHGAQLPARRRLFGLFPPLPPPCDPSREGLRIALDRAVEQLGQAGLHPLRAEGPVDPRRHRVVGRIPAEDEARIGEIAAVHSRGWRMGEDSKERILRPACVDVWSVPERGPSP